MPQLSIITPAFIDNQEKLDWFSETLQSLLTQKFTDWEAIIVDDASPVDLSGLKHKFNDPRFRWLRTPKNSGPALCRNTAAALAESEALLPLDADDILADENSMAILYDAWQTDKSRIVYGDLQRLENGERGKIFNLPEYSFNRALDTNGIMPVTAIHSVECHVKAGGWKPELSFGLEDVEYWIAAGKAGFCGQRVHGVVLLYRRHVTSRHARLRAERHETEMHNKIIDMHRDVYEGRFPMGCCGGGGSSYVPPQSQSQQMNISTPLTEFPAEQKTWVQYQGRREGGFGVAGDFTGKHYEINGPGHKFEVHINDLPKFRRSGRGLDFAVGTAPPIDTRPIIIEERPEQRRYQAPPPILAQIEQLDPVAAVSRGLSVSQEQTPVNGKAESVSSGFISPDLINSLSEDYQVDYDLEPLGLRANVQAMLEAESWSVEKLAGAAVDDLKFYPGIGQQTAERIIQKAKDHLNG